MSNQEHSDPLQVLQPVITISDTVDVFKELDTDVIQDRPYIASSVIKNLRLIETVFLQNADPERVKDNIHLKEQYAYVYVSPEHMSTLYGARYFYVRHQCRLYQRESLYGCYKLILAIDEAKKLPIGLPGTQ